MKAIFVTQGRNWQHSRVSGEALTARPGSEAHFNPNHKCTLFKIKELKWFFTAMP